MHVAEVTDKWERISVNIGNNSRYAIDTVHHMDTVNVLVVNCFSSRSKNFHYSIDLNDKLRSFWPIKNTGLYYTNETYINPIGAIDGDTAVMQASWSSYKKVIEQATLQSQPYNLTKLESTWQRIGKKDLLDSCIYVKVERFKETYLPRIQLFNSFDSIGVEKIDSVGALFTYMNNVDISFNGGHVIMEDAQLIFAPRPTSFTCKLNSYSENKNFTISPWLSLYDVSRFDYKLQLPRDCVIESLEIYFFDPCEFLPIYPEPDVITDNTIYYTDKEKIQRLQLNGFHVTVKLPLLENFQNMKIFVLTSILAFLCTICLNLARELLKNKIEHYRNIIGIISLVILLFVVTSTICIIIKIL